MYSVKKIIVWLAALWIWRNKIGGEYVESQKERYGGIDCRTVLAVISLIVRDTAAQRMLYLCAMVMGVGIGYVLSKYLGRGIWEILLYCFVAIFSTVSLLLSDARNRNLRNVFMIFIVVRVAMHYICMAIQLETGVLLSLTELPFMGHATSNFTDYTILVWALLSAHTKEDPFLLKDDCA